MSLKYSLFDTLLEPVFVLSAEQSVLYCNEVAAIISGISVRKITRGMKFSELFEFSEPIDGLTNLKNITDPTPYKEVNFKTSQGGEGKVQITIQPITGESDEGNWIVFVRDVTLEERLQKKYRAELEQKEGVIEALKAAKAELENYSKNLEQMVAERTRELSRLNQTMSALLDSLSQGFFIFNAEGKVLDVSSKACAHTVEGKPDGKLIWDVLKLPENKVIGFQKWMQTVFMEMLPFEDLAPLGPNRFEHSQGAHISIEYNALRSAEGVIEGIVVVTSDITSLVEAQKQAEYEKEHAKLIINLVKSKREVLRFIKESQTHLEEVRKHLATSQSATSIEEVYRGLHTLKGGAALFSVKNVAHHCHEAESLLSRFQEEKTPTLYQQLQEKCQQVENSFQSFLEETKHLLGPNALTEERFVEVSLSKIYEFADSVEKLPGGKPVAEEILQDLTMEPIAHFLNPYNEVLQQTARQTDKKMAPLKIVSNNVQVPPDIYNSLLATLVHAFRNAVDHGIEFPTLRTAQGKPEEGLVEVSAEIKKSTSTPSLLLTIKDDGAGVDPARIREKLRQRGLNVDQKSDVEIIQHIFDSQFSTRDQITEVSGRGVGMDAIKAAAEQLSGKVWVTSTPGAGTCLFVEVPYLTQRQNVEAPPHKKVA